MSPVTKSTTIGVVPISISKNGHCFPHHPSHPSNPLPLPRLASSLPDRWSHVTQPCHPLEMSHIGRHSSTQTALPAPARSSRSLVRPSPSLILFLVSFHNGPLGSMIHTLPPSPPPGSRIFNMATKAFRMWRTLIGNMGLSDQIIDRGGGSGGRGLG